MFENDANHMELADLTCAHVKVWINMLNSTRYHHRERLNHSSSFKTRKLERIESRINTMVH